jgi:hypothetical protein
MGRINIIQTQQQNIDAMTIDQWLLSFLKHRHIMRPAETRTAQALRTSALSNAVTQVF